MDKKRVQLMFASYQMESIVSYGGLSATTTLVAHAMHYYGVLAQVTEVYSLTTDSPIKRNVSTIRVAVMLL